MATLSTTLTFSSSDATSDTLKVTNTDSLTIGEPAVNIARASIETASATNIITTSNTAITYVYIKNTDSTNFVTVKIDAGTDFAILSAGEFMLIPMKGGVGLEVQADTAACIVEYGYWTKA
jgi:hypothetical protein